MEINSDLMEALKNVFTIVEVVTALVATLYYWKYNTGFFKYFLFFLWYIVFHEAICYFSFIYFTKFI